MIIPTMLRRTTDAYTKLCSESVEIIYIRSYVSSCGGGSNTQIIANIVPYTCIAIPNTPIFGTFT